jgi:hypothetical protein
MLLMLTAETRSQSASDRSTGPPVTAMPTLLWRMSMRLPNAARQRATMASTCEDFETSQANTSAAPPSFVTMPAVSRAAASLMSLQSTLAPSRANSTAAALPLPQPGPDEPAPVTMAVLFSRRLVMIFSRGGRKIGGGAPRGQPGRRLTK